MAALASLYFGLSLLAWGPGLDPIGGQVVGEAEHRRLAAPRSDGALVDLWLTPGTFLGVGTDGLERLDPQRLVVHGWAASQLRPQLGPLDASDPAFAGQSLIDIPYDAWAHVRLMSLWTATPGLTYTLAPPQLQGLQAAVILRGGGGIGGGDWMPPGVFDREPAFAYGAPRARRALRRAYELAADLNLTLGARRAARLQLELIDQHHSYPPVLADEAAARQTVLLQVAAAPRWRGLLAYQHRSRSHAGAFARLPVGLSVPVASDAVLAQVVYGEDLGGAPGEGGGGLLAQPLGYSADGEGDGEDSGGQAGEPDGLDGGRADQAVGPGGPAGAPAGQAVGPDSRTGAPAGKAGASQGQAATPVYLALGAGWRQERPAGGVAGPLAIDLLDPWLWLQRPAWPERVGRLRLDGRLVVALGYGVSFSSRAAWAAVRSRRVGGAPLGTVSYNGVPLSSVRYAPLQVAHQQLGSWRNELAWQGLWGAWSWDAFVGLDLAVVAFDRPLAAPAGELARLAPAAGAAVRLHLGDAAGTLFALVRREPWSLDTTVASFLGRRDPSGTVLRQSDGEPLAQTGGAAHTWDPQLARPWSAHFALGYTSACWGPWRLSLQGVGRALRRRLTVAAVNAAPATPQSFADPGGDGRGESPAGAGGGQSLTVYAQDPAALAAQRYMLVNAADTSLYWGFEFALATVGPSWWFVHLGGSAFMATGGAPFGTFAERNDADSLDESSASPNAQLHGRGRYDGDRAYTLRLLAGLEPWENLSLALNGRYRDGQPSTRFVVAPALPQGPTAIMAVDRGKVRFTYLMTWDLRLRYQLTFVSQRLELTADVYNILGSATEILEDPRTGPTFRRALEAITNRTLMVGLRGEL